MHRRFHLFIVAALATTAACGGSPQATSDGGKDGGAGADTGPQPQQCGLEPKGTFTLHLRNHTAASFTWLVGCNTDLPFTLDTPKGTMVAGPGRISSCGFTCDQIYSGDKTPNACSDCPNFWQTIPAGATADLLWDRRVYSLHTIEPGCPRASAECALGQAIAPAMTQAGTLHICARSLANTCDGGRAIPFTLDTTKDEATIDVN